MLTTVFILLFLLLSAAKHRRLLKPRIFGGISTDDASVESATAGATTGAASRHEDPAKQADDVSANYLLRSLVRFPYDRCDHEYNLKTVYLTLKIILLIIAFKSFEICVR